MATPQLIRGTSLPGAILLGLGAIVGTGAYVSIAMATSITGSGVLIAILIAALVAACNGLSSAQLAAVHPVSGGTYEYGYKFLNHWFGFSAGWLFVAAKSASAATAALALSLYVLPALGLAHGWQVPLALLTIAIMTLLVLAGVRRSNQANAVIVTVAIGALLVFVFTTFSAYEPTLVAAPTNAGSAHDILAAAALIFVAYTGYGRIATMGEEITSPKRNIPLAIIATVLVTTALYLLLGWALQYTNLQQQGVNESELALVALASNDTVATVVLVGAAVALLGVMLNLILGVSRVILAMGRRGDLPAVFGGLNVGQTSAPAATWLTAVVMMALALSGSVELAWSFSAFTVLVYYGITNLAALQIPAQQRFVPRAISVLGLISCLALTLFIEWRVLAAGGLLILAGLVWHRWRLHLVANK
ncbi:amino acid/polyamine/organocation transporter, APC superfamily [Pseudidiomarina planktonica]|uniref:Amino acid/polyamine/organocation transporter, APC superfamily n=1 Tax=Pseudidiomarina planktonica TaxID=1323738 RepID=A0A1Y6FZI1_9GAMM|nr:APC family permease [Pseudidiomarina planktonica]RUO63296.1 amino acid permease [Pseudidiomarina planktonica]SMQ80486.1 amino acid/polyamine/organocation transporter, APC superfamily [Pseudidiomarina planktonica]